MAHVYAFIYLNQEIDSFLILGDRFSEGTKLPGRSLKMICQGEFDISLPSSESRRTISESTNYAESQHAPVNDLLAEILGYVVKVQRHGNRSRGIAIRFLFNS